jgi:hypothetical protein
MPDDDLETLAANALQQFAGVDEPRARALVLAWKTICADEALAIVAGTARVTTTVGEIRVERLHRLVAALEEGRLPTPYELAVLLRITVSQARTVVNNWKARYPEAHESRMRAGVKRAKHDTGGKQGSPAWVIEYDDAETFAYAIELLRRHAMDKGLAPDRPNLRIEIPKTTKAGGKDALEILGIAK